MPTLNEIDEKVNELNNVTGNSFEFRDALNDIQAVAQTPVAIAELRPILSRFRGKIPDLPTFNRIRVDAKDLAEVLMLTSVEQRIARIRDRNDLLTDLTDSLEAEAKKANNDAALLTQIKAAVEKATKTVGEIKGLINDLNVTEGSVKNQLLALVERIGNISSIFQPQDA